ncbi:MAG: hypothetical protein DRI44_00865 [Chlamydiae bacterium]|nr:MAG: hypothetical protein DRI44_00865 [Chlamydiota bacterium]
MKTKQFLFVIAILFLSVTSILATQKKSDIGLISIPKVINASKKITTNAFPNSDEVIVADFTKTEYYPNGTHQSIYDQCIKVLTEKGKRNQRTSSIGYDTAYGTAVVLKVQIIKPNGKIIPVDIKKNTKDMVEASQMDMNIYNPNSRVVKISFPDLEIGDMARLLLKKTETKPRVPNTWYDIEVMEAPMPIVHQEIKIIAPKKRPLKHIVLKNEITNTVKYTKKTGATTVTHKWVVRNVPRMFAEPGMPAYKPLQHLLLSTIPKWEQVSKWYYKLCEPRLQAVTPEMSNKVEELTAGITDPNKKIKAIFKFVSQKIRYMGITTEDTAPGYEPHDVSITFENKYGVCRDKAALLAAMLRIAGFDAYTTLMLGGQPKKDQEVPNAFFNHAITAIKNDNASYSLMDTTDETTKDLLPVYLNNCSYMVASPKGETLKTTPIIPAEKNLVKVTTNAKYNNKGYLKATSKIVFEGINDRAYRGAFAKMELDEIRRVFEGIIKKVAPGAKITDFSLEPDDMMDLTRPIVVEIEYTAPDLFVSGKKETMLAIPWFGPSVGLANRILSGSFGLDKRKYPLKTDLACGIKETVNLNLKNAVGKNIALPKFDNIDNKLIKWSRTINTQNNKLSGEGEFLVKAVEFSTNEYLEMKKLLKKIEYNNRKQPIFETISFSGMDDEDFDESENSYSYTPEGDTEISEQIIDTDVKNSRNWTTTSKVTKEILTYAGKKDNAEIKIHYNPSWENVEIIKAVVTDTDGNEKKLSKNELNLMDAGWVASAPRYPPGKILVASLPDVDVGNIIEYEIKRTYKKHPFYALRTSFNSFDSIVDETVRVALPATTRVKVKNPDSDEIESSKNEEDGKIIYEWKTSDQRPVRKEKNLPPWYYFNPTVFLSTGNWTDYADKVGRIFLAAAKNQTECAAKAKELTANSKTDNDKIIAIRDFVTKNIRSAGPSFVSMPLSAVTPANITLKDGYGNGADKAIVIYSMLKAIGLKPQFILSSWLSMVKKVRKPMIEYPLRSTFGGVLVKVKSGDNDIYLNDTSQYASLGSTPHDGRPGLILPKGKISIINASSNKADKTEVEYTIKLSENGDAEITKTTKSFGTTYASDKKYFDEITPEDRKRYFQNAISTISQGATPVGNLITKFDSYPGIEQLTVKVDKFAILDGDFLYLKVPISLNNILGLKSDVRDNPVSWGNKTKMILTASVELPKEFDNVKLTPPDITWKAPENAGTITTKTLVSGSKIKIIDSVDINPAVISVDDYDDLLEINRKLSHPRMRTILVSRKTAAK